MAYYWLEWILEFETLCKHNKELCIAETRSFAPVLDKYKKDTIWIVWDIILNSCKENPLIKKIINSLLEIFSIKYTSGVKKKRRFIIYFVINLLTENVDFNIDIISDKQKIDNIMKKIGLVYKDVKKNEITLGTDYLFAGIEKTNLDKTIERLEKMNELLH
jgi:hypothetical protein